MLRGGKGTEAAHQLTSGSVLRTSAATGSLKAEVRRTKSFRRGKDDPEVTEMPHC